MKVRQFFDLTYCSNIHPGENWEEHFAHLKKTVLPLKEVLAPKQKFGLGLRIGNQASKDLLDKTLLENFKDWLKQRNLYVFTLNGFPYGAFHVQMVKEKVHQPDWTTTERVSYTKRLFSLLKALIPAGEEGSISTSPIGYKPGFNSKDEQVDAFKKGAHHLTEIIIFLRELENEGFNFHLDLEPEPDGLLENSTDVINFFNNYLIPIALEKFNGSDNECFTPEDVCKYIRVCYDVCHFSVVFEEQVLAIKRLTEAGIKIGKIQLSSALKVLVDERLSPEKAISDLKKFNEPVYLHQVAAKKSNGEITRYADLQHLLEDPIPDGIQELRSHFHVPVFLEEYEGLSSTQNEIVTVINNLMKGGWCKHLEVETYTWDVLPKALQMNVTDSIERELKWVISTIEDSFK